MNKKRKDGYLCSTFTIDGKRYFVYGNTTKELHDKELKKREEIENKLDSKYNPTVEEYYNKRLECRQEGLKPNTVRNISRAKLSVCKIFIASSSRYFGEIKLKKVTSDDLREVQRVLSSKCTPQTVNNYMSQFKHLFYDAIRERLITVNPFDMISNLKKTGLKARDTIHRALSRQEQEAFFSCELTQNNKYYNVFCMAICTGMRIGEIGALKYKDIKSNHILVQRSVTRIDGDKWGIGEDTKTPSGKRKIPLTEDVRAILDRQKQLNQIRKGNNIVEMEELIFVGARGGLIEGQYVNQEIKNICEYLGIAIFTTHAFRDTFATRAIENNMNPKTLQEILGHKDYAMTMNLYAHALDETKEQEMNNLKISI